MYFCYTNIEVDSKVACVDKVRNSSDVNSSESYFN